MQKPSRREATPSLKAQTVSVSGELPQATAAENQQARGVADRFELKQLLGQGGMGSVFVAQDRGLGRVVALKLLRDELGGDRSALRRFVLEAQIGAQLEHPNIVPLYSFERTEAGAPAIAMQLLEGQTMAAYIDAAAAAEPKERAPRGTFALKERVGMLLGACDAIHFAHERSVMHRDLKPDNVMLGQHREVYVMDWGLARVINGVDPSADASSESSASGGASVATPSTPPPKDAAERADLESLPTVLSQEPKVDSAGHLATQQGQVMGTPQYMPPEQALGRMDLMGPAADQYALGVMLLELAILKPARSHTNLMQALAEAVRGSLAEPIDVDGRPVPPPLLAIIRRATARAPLERYPSVRELGDDVRRFIRDDPVSVYPEGPARQLVRAASRRPAVATGIVAGLFLLAAASVIVSLTRSAEQARRAAHDVEGTRKVLVAVSRRVQAVDVRLSDLGAGVEAIAGAAVQNLELDGGAAPLLPPPELKPSAAYGGALESFAQAAVLWPGKDDGVDVPESAAKLLGIERWLRRALVDALPPNERRASSTEQEAALFAGHGSLLRCFVGIEDGSFVQYPAREFVKNEDIRARPWYRMAASDPSLHWTRPVVDIAGRTLRMQVSVGLTGSRGDFLGVAGCDLRVSSLARSLALDLPGFRRAYLVTEDGKIAVRDDLESKLLAATKDVNGLPELPALEDAALLERIRHDDAGGYVVEPDGTLGVYAKLISPPWTYVAELDAAPYLSR